MRFLYTVSVIGLCRAFLFEHNVLHELGGVNNDTSSANDINSSGQIVGSATNDAGDDFAFLYNDGIMYDLNDLCTENNDDRSIGSAYLINNSGRIICWDNTLHGYILLIPIS